MTEPNDSVANRLVQLGREYRARLPLELDQLTTLAQGLVDQQDAHAVLLDLHRRLHKLAGSGGTFGLDDLSRAARALEVTIQTWLAAGFSATDAAQRRRLADDVAALKATTGEI